ncbi:oligopeptide ABC transporter permease [Microaerobacter geothermalis]|uniref:oligopeptide ABC transporter permease n=1 Tax=Microaerobacter geothermalis TaxID=674972 RepID=UPI0038B3D6B7
MTWRRFRKNKLAVSSLIFIVFIILLSLFADFITPYEVDQQNLLKRLHPPSSEYYFGTDEFGRDLFTRVIYGGRVSLLVGFVSVTGSILIGTVVGAIAGYYGKWIDNILMRIVDILLSFPSIFLLITVVSIIGPDLKNIIIIFAILGWTGTARLVRGEFLSLKEREFVLAAKTIGMSDARIIVRHLLPNAMGPIIVSATLGVGGVILAESGLSYLGLGIQPPTPSWGNMLQSAQSITIMLEAPWYPFLPGLMILLTVLAFNFVGDGLRDALDPKE